METKFSDPRIISEEHAREVTLAYWLHTIRMNQRKAQAPNILVVRALHEAMLFFHRELRQNGFDIDFHWDSQSSRYLKVDQILEKLTENKILKKSDNPGIREFNEPGIHEKGLPGAGKRLENIFNPQGQSLINRDEKELLDKAYTHAMSTYYASVAQYPPPHTSVRHVST